MSLIAILEENIRLGHKKNWLSFLLIEKLLVEKHFNWIGLIIDNQSKSLIGKGTLNVEGKDYEVLLSYSPNNKYRYDRIYINDKSIEFNNEIHLYGDKSLCLYHPIFFFF